MLKDKVKALNPILAAVDPNIQLTDKLKILQPITVRNRPEVLQAQHLHLPHHQGLRGLEETHQVRPEYACQDA